MTATVIPTTRHRLAELVEWVLLPLLAGFAAGFIVAQQADEVRLAQAATAVAQARQAVQRTEARLDLIYSACEPLLSWPVEATPEILPAPVAPRAATLARARGTP